jgi:tetratricopeptide (TPR) repeat protein
MNPPFSFEPSAAQPLDVAAIEAPAAPVQTIAPLEPEDLATDSAREKRLAALRAKLENRTGLDRLPPVREALRDDPADADLRRWLFHELLDLDALDEAEALIDGAAPGLAKELAASLAHARNRPRREQLWRQIESVSPERRVELLYEALAEDPEDDEAREWLVHELLESKRGREAAKLARDAEPSLRSFLTDEIARRAPADLPDDLLDERRGARSLAIVPALIERGAIDDAARCVEEAIDGLSGSYLGDILDPIVALAAADEGDTAESLLQRLTTVLDRFGLATRVSQQDALTMLFLGELFAVWDDLPARAWAITLGGIRAFDGFEQAREEAKRWARDESDQAQLAVEALARRAPNLSAVLGDAFQPPLLRRRPASLTSAPPSAPVRGSLWFAIVAVMMLGGLVRGVTRCSSFRSPSDSRPPLSVAMAPLRLSRACDVAPDECGAIRTLSSALRARDCARAVPTEPEVRTAITALEADPRSSSAAALIELRRMISELESTCPYSPPPP